MKVLSTYSTGRRLHAFGDGAFMKHVTDSTAAATKHVTDSTAAFGKHMTDAVARHQERTTMVGPCTLTVCS